MSEKFTEGPWEYDASDGVILGPTGRPLFSAIPTGVPYQRNDNGKVAAAAPELYAACRSAYDELRRAGSADRWPVVHQLRDALAKARKESADAAEAENDLERDRRLR